MLRLAVVHKSANSVIFGVIKMRHSDVELIFSDAVLNECSSWRLLMPLGQKVLVL